MSWLQVVVLAIIQGLSEFLPISSSGHLLIPSQITDWPDQGLAFDVAVHLGTLCAVLIYFKRDLIDMASHWFRFGFTKTRQTQHSRMAWMLMLATIPVVIVGYLAQEFIETHLRNIWVIATATFIFALLLAWADSVSQRADAFSSNTLTLKSALIIGCWQMLALIPGTSRSGITISGALLLGLDRVQAARFSFLLSIPVISAAALLYGLELYTAGSSIAWQQFAVGMLISAVSAYACIYLFLAWIERIGMMPFVWYRIILALVLFCFAIF